MLNICVVFAGILGSLIVCNTGTIQGQYALNRGLQDINTVNAVRTSAHAKIVSEKEANRVAIYQKTVQKLQSLSDQQLELLLNKATRMRGDFGGLSGSLFCLELDGVRIFVKAIPLSDVEMRPDCVQSTANLFGLPSCYQYGVGSLGFGAWRELAAHSMTTQWVLDSDCVNFPLLYHARVLNRLRLSPLFNKINRIDSWAMNVLCWFERRGVNKQWDNIPAIKNRHSGIQNTASSLVLFMEYIPQTLQQWFDDHVIQDAEIVKKAFSSLEKQLMSTSLFMKSHGMLHFDAHSGNILTDGEQLYFTDFGLALSSHFTLSHSEAAFFRRHKNYDICYQAKNIVEGILFLMYGNDIRYEKQKFRKTVLNAYAAGRIPEGIPDNMAAALKKYAPIASIFSTFLGKVHKDKTAIYPVEELQRACVAAGLDCQ